MLMNVGQKTTVGSGLDAITAVRNMEFMDKMNLNFSSDIFRFVFGFFVPACYEEKAFFS